MSIGGRVSLQRNHHWAWGQRAMGVAGWQRFISAERVLAHCLCGEQPLGVGPTSNGLLSRETDCPQDEGIAICPCGEQGKKKALVNNHQGF